MLKDPTVRFVLAFCTVLLLSVIVILLAGRKRKDH